MGQQERLKIAQIDSDIGHWIANIRADYGYTQQQLAVKCKTRQSSISRIENGKVSPSLTTLARLFEAMEIRVYLAVSDV